MKSTDFVVAPFDKGGISGVSPKIIRLQEPNSVGEDWSIYLILNLPKLPLQHDSVSRRCLRILNALVRGAAVDGQILSLDENRFSMEISREDTIIFTGNLYQALNILRGFFIADELHGRVLEELKSVRPEKTSAEIRCFDEYMEEWRVATQEGRPGSRGPHPDFTVISNQL